MVDGRRPFYTWDFGPKWWPITPFKNGDFQSIFARSSSAGIPSEKVQLSLRKSSTGFQMSVRQQTLPLSPQRRAQKRKVAVFRTKVDLSCKKSTLLVFWHRQRLVRSILTHADPPKTDPSCSAFSLRQLSYCYIYVYHWQVRTVTGSCVICRDLTRSSIIKCL